MTQQSTIRKCEFCGVSYVSLANESDERLCSECYTPQRRIVVDQVYLAEKVLEHFGPSEISKHWSVLTSGWDPLQAKLILFTCLCPTLESGFKAVENIFGKKGG